MLISFNSLHLINRHFITSHPQKKGEYNTVDILRPHSTTVIEYIVKTALLFVIINLLLCLIYKLSFIVGTYVK